VIWALMTDIETGGTMAERAYNLTFKQDTYQVDVAPPPEPAKTDAGSAAGSAAAPEVKKPDPKPATKPEGGDPKPIPDSGRSEA
jgi:hypothetical protein